MSENPYQAPAVSDKAVGVRSGRPIDLLAVARYQRGINYCILIQVVIYIGLLVVAAILTGAQFDVFFPVWILGNLACLVAACSLVVLLAMKVYHPLVGIILGFMAFIPCLGLLVLLLINGKATTILKQNGVRVGLLGARDLSHIYDAMARERVE